MIVQQPFKTAGGDPTEINSRYYILMSALDIKTYILQILRITQHNGQMPKKDNIAQSIHITSHSVDQFSAHDNLLCLFESVFELIISHFLHRDLIVLKLGEL